MLGKILSLIAAQLLVVVFWGGFVTEVLWNWFMTPLHVPAITFWHAVGLTTLVVIFTSRPPESRSKGDIDDAYSQAVSTLAYCVALPGFVLLIGWFAKLQLG